MSHGIMKPRMQTYFEISWDDMKLTAFDDKYFEILNEELS